MYWHACTDTSKDTGTMVYSNAVYALYTRGTGLAFNSIETYSINTYLRYRYSNDSYADTYSA